mgnify:CR=1 FL=1
MDLLLELITQNVCTVPEVVARDTPVPRFQGSALLFCSLFVVVVTEMRDACGRCAARLPRMLVVMVESAAPK